MSRSTKKAILKDCGHMKDVYWKVHRRTNKKIVKHFFESARHRVTKYDNWDDFFEYKKKFQKEGYSEEEAHLMASYEVEDNEDFPLCSNCHIDWAEEPDVKYPKELINDWDYCDYIIDEEYDYSTFTFMLEVERREDRKKLIKKMQRK